MLKVSSNALLQQHGSGTEPHVAELIVSVSSICEQAISHLLQELLVTQPCCSVGLSHGQMTSFAESLWVLLLPILSLRVHGADSALQGNVHFYLEEAVL